MNIGAPLFAVHRVVRSSFTIVVAFVCLSADAQVNSWTNPTSGKWEGATNWSLGVAPGAGQSIFVTNQGWKVVSIDNNTAVNFPQTMSISGLRITSPDTDTTNAVLLNYAGLQTPLAISGDLYLGTNTSLSILQSALRETNGTVLIGGTVTEEASSQVSTEHFQIMGGGVYNLTNGSLTVPQFVFETVQSGAQFHLAGGSNFCYALHVDGGGEYDISGGQLALPPPSTPDEGILDLGNMVQSGGTLKSVLSVGESGTGGGMYQLSSGFLSADYLGVPANPPDATGSASDTSYFIQTGGTNEAGSMDVGQVYIGFLSIGVGSYLLTNGLVISSNLAINAQGTFYQYGGIHTNGSMTLSGAELTSRGTNVFVPGYYYLNGGTLISGTVSDQSSVFSQAAGSCEVTTLQVGGGQYNLSGGQLNVSNIVLSGGANFTQTGGTVTQTGTLTLSDSFLTGGPSAQQFGQLQLSGNTNSSLTLSPGASALHFANSGSLAWSNAASLIISNWSGSLSGGGSQQILFGNDQTGLTPQQLGQVQFINPAGLPSGTYPAQILSNGEVVPSSVIAATVAFSTQGNNLVLTWPAGWILQSSTNVSGPYSDVTNATSPYTNNMTFQPEQFFRLRQ